MGFNAELAESNFHIETIVDKFIKFFKLGENLWEVYFMKAIVMGAGGFIGSHGDTIEK